MAWMSVRVASGLMDHWLPDVPDVPEVVRVRWEQLDGPDRTTLRNAAVAGGIADSAGDAAVLAFLLTQVREQRRREAFLFGLILLLALLLISFGLAQMVADGLQEPVSFAIAVAGAAVLLASSVGGWWHTGRRLATAQRRNESLVQS